MTMTEPVCVAIASEAKPMQSGNKVPPNKPMIIKPETSFLLSGTVFKACAKIMENTLEFPKPIRAMQTYMAITSDTKNNPDMPATIISTLTMKKLRAEKRASRKDPDKQPKVRNKKYTLEANAASSTVMPALSISNFGAATVFPITRHIRQILRVLRQAPHGWMWNTRQ